MININKHIIILFILSLFFTFSSCEDNFYDLMETENRTTSQSPDADKWTQAVISITGREGMITINDTSTNKTYLFGGRDYGIIRSDLWVVDNTTNSSQYLGNGMARAFASGAIINNKLYIFGGIDSSNSLNNDFLVYDIASNTWGEILSSSTTGASPNSRYRHAGFGYNNLVFIHGGATSYGEGYNSSSITDKYIYSFDPDTLTWDKLSKGPLLMDHSAVVSGSSLYFFGGFGKNPQLSLIDFSNILWKYTYDALDDDDSTEYDTDTWSIVTAITNDQKRCSTAMVSLNDTLYMISGYNGATINNILSYNTSNDTWTVIDLLTTPRFNHSAWVFDDAVKIFGGLSEDSGNLYPEDIWTYTP